jgi:hypothetical protein
MPSMSSEKQSSRVGTLSGEHAEGVAHHGRARHLAERADMRQARGAVAGLEQALFLPCGDCKEAHLPKPTIHEALIYLMVVTSASDREMTDVELAHIGDSVRSWPIFLDYDEQHLVNAARDCQQLLQRPDGLDKVFQIVLDTVPLHMHDTAYAIAVEVAVIDRRSGWRSGGYCSGCAHGWRWTSRLRAASNCRPRRATGP